MQHRGLLQMRSQQFRSSDEIISRYSGDPSVVTGRVGSGRPA